jgi:hypothetical protein
MNGAVDLAAASARAQALGGQQPIVVSADSAQAIVHSALLQAATAFYLSGAGEIAPDEAARMALGLNRALTKVAQEQPAT